ncbi:uncharacterized protein At1g24485-like [Punica granatum]|uniref:Malectin-like domain-containing protein n=2 Tax=Punica granatum TaxID=22663 RepID=A0A218XXW0_PUNGR|nr:uncharacterized protein At1g24485-like [Punica granatum]OWM89341.1 hypothetical protein CDL15_Pgr024089 [Punica granatum]PKI61967.1 hypothetical protein CRG98_017693 [Punica granatum]
MATSFLLLILIALSPFSAFASVSWSIDCGASDSYIDDNLIVWQGDDTLVSAGQSRTVKTTDSLHVTSTLRVFTSGKKNCYVLEGEKGAKLLVRASFFYGNYDGKSSPPSFGLQIDGNDWVKVVTDMETETYIYYELIYVSKGDSISMCLVQTDSSQYPFISALEVRTLESPMYRNFDANQALSLVGRHAFGAVKSIRDKYDRIWGPATLTGTEFTSVESSALSIDTTTVSEDPPEEAVQNAMTTSSSSAESMKWALTGLDSTLSPIYLNLYFSEVSQLDTTDKRSFSIYLGDKLVDKSSTGLSPSYGSVGEVTIYNAMASKNTTIMLTSTSDSTLPPIINALELFQVINYTAYSTATTSNSPGTSSGGGSGSTPSPTSSDTETPTSTDDEAAPSSGKKKSNLPVILGAGIPGVLLLVAFVVVLVAMQQKRQRAAMAAATQAGGGNGQGAAYNNNYNGKMMMGATVGQETINEFKVNVNEDQPTNQEDPNNQLQYGSPAPLLNETRQ